MRLRSEAECRDFALGQTLRVDLARQLLDASEGDFLLARAALTLWESMPETAFRHILCATRLAARTVCDA